MGTTPLRRGLPRTPGGEPWPPAGFAPASESAPPASAEPAEATVFRPVPETAADTEAATDRVASEASEAASSTAAAPVREPELARRTVPAPEERMEPVQPEATQPRPVQPKPAPAKPVQPKRYGSRTLAQWVRLGLLAGIGAVLLAALFVLAARGLMTFAGAQSFMARFPGEYHLPDSAQPGFPAWAQWAHFFNIFLIVLIIRTGLQVRHQQKPPAYWTPRGSTGGRGKISITLWLHQSLDLLWLVNGIVFVVLLFVSGHWMRIVPTSWEVFPNALSALVQYVSLDWPTENGWVNYNSLQQLMYFTVVFIAAPLAVITGARMSDLWPKSAKALSKAYPVEVARAIHYPTMLFFSLFIVVHVALVFATGALRNLNHMFGGTDTVSWAGFWLFAATIFITAVGWIAARPIVVAPVARLFGQVSSR